MALGLDASKKQGNYTDFALNNFIFINSTAAFSEWEVIMRSSAKIKAKFWPVYIKSPKIDISSFALNLVIRDRLNQNKDKFQIERVIENTSYSYCPHTKIYINHNSFNTGEESHFLYYEGGVFGSVVIKMAEDQISNWQKNIVHAKVIEFLKHSLNPVDVIHHENSFIFDDNYSLKAGFTLYMELKDNDYNFFVVNIYLDLSQELGKIISKL